MKKKICLFLIIVFVLAARPAAALAEENPPPSSEPEDKNRGSDGNTVGVAFANGDARTAIDFFTQHRQRTIYAGMDKSV